MIARRTRVILWSFLAVLAAWSLALAGYLLARNARMTAEKVTAFLTATDFGRLPPPDRDATIQRLADRLNALSLEDRRRVRRSEPWKSWLDQMTDAEKEKLITATFPSGITQMLTAFQQLSQSQRQRMVDDALGRLRSSGELAVGGETFLHAPGEGQGPAGSGLNPRLAERIREVGLQTFFSESSAQTKVEAAPLLEEIQRQLQSGGWGRNRNR